MCKYKDFKLCQSLVYQRKVSLYASVLHPAALCPYVAECKQIQALGRGANDM